MCAIVMAITTIIVPYVLMSRGLGSYHKRRRKSRDSEVLTHHGSLSPTDPSPFLMSRPLPLSPLVAYNKGRGAGSRYTTPLGHREPSSTAVLLWWTYYALGFLFLIIKKGVTRRQPLVYYIVCQMAPLNWANLASARVSTMIYANSPDT